MTLTFATLAKEARERMGLSQAALAARLDLGPAGQQTVHRWEKGSEPPKEKLAEIIEVLGLDRDDVLRGLGFGDLLPDATVGPRTDTELRYKRPPGLTDRQWAKVKREMADHLDYQIERASKER